MCRRGRRHARRAFRDGDPAADGCTQRAAQLSRATVDHCSHITSPISSIALWQRGGAAARIGEDDTAFGGRDAGFTFNINGNTQDADGFDEQRAWVRDFWEALVPHHQGAYVNFMNDEGIDAIKRTYGAAKFDRLRSLKRTYDPDNLFRLNQNIPPG